MILIIKKDGQIVTDDGNPVEVSAMDNAAVILADPQDGDSIVYDAADGMWKAGNPFPVSITEPADGDTLAYDEASGKWVNVHAEAAGGGE